MPGNARRSHARRGVHYQSDKVVSNRVDFDFGSGMPLPPTKHQPLVLLKQSQPEFKEETPFEIVRATFHGADDRAGGSPFRSFANCADTELLDYLRARRISPFFLNEIDKFLSSHPEIARHRHEFTEVMNHDSPLKAYLFFVKGYTKPARYIDGSVPDAADIPWLDNPISLASKQDQELVDFFGGYEYRTDILVKIDAEAKGIVDAVYHGRRVNMPERRLVVLAWYGNPVDAYKYYEYNYQTEWLAHRYLPEHVVLSEIPKQPGYTEPNPRQISRVSEGCEENMRSHPGTRARMARAADQGVDVIEVLLDDFTSALVRQGLKRLEIERMRKEAVRNIDHQRDTQGGRDIVDMVMNHARLTTPAHFGRQPAKRDASRMQRISSSKNSLRRLVMQEGSMFYDEPYFVQAQIRKSRQRVERDLVFDVTQLAMQAQAMHPKMVSEWRKAYTRQAQIKREASGMHIDLLTQLAPFL